MRLNMSIDDLLVEWGNWSNAGLGLTLDYSGHFIAVNIDDDTALVVDAAVGLLGAKYPNTQQVVILTFRSNLPYRVVAKKLGLGETRTRMLLNRGIAWIEGNLVAKDILIQQAA